MLVAFLTGGEHHAHAAERIERAEEELWAPNLVDAEVGHVLRREVALGKLSPTAGRAGLDDLADMPLHRAGHLMLLDRAWGLRGNLTFYDALYIALAERLGMRLLTLDGRLARAPGVRTPIDLIP